MISVESSYSLNENHRSSILFKKKDIIGFTLVESTYFLYANDKWSIDD